MAEPNIKKMRTYYISEAEMSITDFKTEARNKLYAEYGKLFTSLSNDPEGTNEIIEKMVRKEAIKNMKKKVEQTNKLVYKCISYPPEYEKEYIKIVENMVDFVRWA